MAQVCRILIYILETLDLHCLEGRWHAEPDIHLLSRMYTCLMALLAAGFSHASEKDYTREFF